MENEYGEGYGYNYYELVRKSDGKQVYTSPVYLTGGHGSSVDIEKVKKTLNYYFERVNSYIDQQLENPRLTSEQKSELSRLDPRDYSVSLSQCLPMGYFHKTYWTREASDFLR